MIVGRRRKKQDILQCYQEHTPGRKGTGKSTTNKNKQERTRRKGLSLSLSFSL
jgi:hypothetical protein